MFPGVSSVIEVRHATETHRTSLIMQLKDGVTNYLFALGYIFCIIYQQFIYEVTSEVSVRIK